MRVTVTSSIYLLDIYIQTGDTFINEQQEQDKRGEGHSRVDANYLYIKRNPTKQAYAHTHTHMNARARTNTQRGGKPHHKSRTTETGVAIAGIILDADPLDAGLGKALINVILTVKACPTCQEQTHTECNGEPGALPLPPSEVNIKHAPRTLICFFFFLRGGVEVGAHAKTRKGFH